MNKEIEIKVDKNFKVDLSEVIQMKIEYELLINKLKEKLLKLEDKYIHNVPCCNEEDCDFYKKYKEDEADLTAVYLKGYEDGKEKYNHYKLLYQKVKERNDKAIKFIEKNKHYISIEDMNMYLYEDDINKVLQILKNNNEDVKEVR